MLVRLEDWIVMLSQQSLSQHLACKPNHALVYTVTKEFVNKANTKGIFYALHSLHAPESVDTFKFRMGYRPVIVKQRVAFNPLVSRLINRRTLAILNAFLHHNPSSPLLAKAAGMMSMYIDGRKPLGEQQFPEVLKPKQAELQEKYSLPTVMNSP